MTASLCFAFFFFCGIACGRCLSRVLVFQGAVGILFVDKFLYVRLFVCHRTCVLSYLRCAWVSEALGISVWATQRWQPVVLCGERFSYEVVPLVRPRAACVFVVSRAHVFVAGVVVFVCCWISRHHWWNPMAGLWVCCSLSFCGTATRMRSLAVHGQCRYLSDMEHSTTDSFPDGAFVSILI